jgi:hypothetical protein
MLETFFEPLENCNIHETLTYVEIHGKNEKIDDCLIIKLFDELKNISTRDKFELFLDISGNEENITDTSFDSLNKLKNLIAENPDAIEYDFDLKITKHIFEKTISIYFIEKLSSFLAHEPIRNSLSVIADKFENYIFFEIHSTIEMFQTESIIFYPKGLSPDRLSAPSEYARNKKNDLFLECCNAVGIPGKIIPSDFYFTSKCPLSSLESLFKKISIMLSLSYIANSSELNDKNGFSYKINGYKTISSTDTSLEELEPLSEILHKIYEWTYEGGNKIDKLGLVRNVLSIHTGNSGEIKFDNEAWDAIQSNYQVYLKENIQTYLEIKNKIGEFIIEFTSRSYNMADELLTSLKNNIIILMTFILSVVIVNGFKDNNGANFFSKEYLAVVYIISMLSIVWVIASISETKKRFITSSKTVKKILKLNYEKLIPESEINNIADPVISQNKIYLETNLHRYMLWWIIIVVLFSVSFSAYYFYSTSIQDEPKADQHDIKSDV